MTEGIGPEIAKAIISFNAGEQTAKKDGDNSHFHSTYATLESVIKATRKPMAECGLSIVQLMGGGGGEIEVTTILVHVSGQTIETTASLKLDKPGPQAYGSCATYLKRYSWQAILGLPTSDDDGEAGEGRGGGAPQPKAKPAPVPPNQQDTTIPDGQRLVPPPSGDDGRPLSEQQRKMIYGIAFGMCDGVKDDAFAAIDEVMQANGFGARVQELTSQQASTVIDALREMEAGAKEQPPGEYPAAPADDDVPF